MLFYVFVQSTSSTGSVIIVWAKQTNGKQKMLTESNVR